MMKDTSRDPHSDSRYGIATDLWRLSAEPGEAPSQEYER